MHKRGSTQAVDSKGGQMSKLPSVLGTNLTQMSETRGTSEVYAVPKLAMRKIDSVLSTEIGQTPGGSGRPWEGARQHNTQRRRGCMSIKWSAVVRCQQKTGDIAAWQATRTHTSSAALRALGWYYCSRE